MAAGLLTEATKQIIVVDTCQRDSSNWGFHSFEDKEDNSMWSFIIWLKGQQRIYYCIFVIHLYRAGSDFECLDAMRVGECIRHCRQIAIFLVWLVRYKTKD